MFIYIWEVFCCILLLLVGIVFVMLIARTAKYQKLWEKEKALRIRIKPNISRAELHEYYIMFCKRNNCDVEF